jgi:bifunctional non-homologous end joining protein LigD
MKKPSISHPDKVLFKNPSITKEELIDYYIFIYPMMKALIFDRALMMHRFVEGIDKTGFYQKNVENFPTWIKRVSVSRQEKENIEMVLCNNLETLIYIINLDTITLHGWLSKKDKLNIPDRIVFDLDPPKGNFHLAKEAAFDLKDLLENELSLKPFVLTTGSKGLHVIVSIKREKDFTFTHKFAKNVGFLLSKRFPKKYTIEPRKEKRQNKLLIDYMRNSFAQTSVVPYSVRALPKGPIAMPLFWDELQQNIHAQSFNLKNYKKFLSKRKDPFRDFFKNTQSILKADKKLKKLLEKLS